MSAVNVGSLVVASGTVSDSRVLEYTEDVQRIH